MSYSVSLKQLWREGVFVWLLSSNINKLSPESQTAALMLFKRSIAHGLKCMAQVHLGRVPLHFCCLTAHNLGAKYGARRKGVVFSLVINHSVLGVTWIKPIRMSPPTPFKSHVCLHCYLNGGFGKYEWFSAEETDLLVREVKACKQTIYVPVCNKQSVRALWTRLCRRILLSE